MNHENLLYLSPRTKNIELELSDDRTWARNGLSAFSIDKHANLTQVNLLGFEPRASLMWATVLHFPRVRAYVS